MCMQEAFKWCDRYKPFGAVKHKDEMVFNRKTTALQNHTSKQTHRQPATAGLEVMYEVQ